jgi:hypothetical protein
VIVYRPGIFRLAGSRLERPRVRGADSELCPRDRFQARPRRTVADHRLRVSRRCDSDSDLGRFLRDTPRPEADRSQPSPPRAVLPRPPSRRTNLKAKTRILPDSDSPDPGPGRGTPCGPLWRTAANHRKPPVRPRPPSRRIFKLRVYAPACASPCTGGLVTYALACFEICRGGPWQPSPPAGRGRPSACVLVRLTRTVTAPDPGPKSRA